MSTATESNYHLQSPYFSFWQVMAFILAFAFVGSWVIRTFAGAPQIKRFTAINLSTGRADLIVEASKKPADDLVVTNTCHASGSTLTNTQTSGFSDWTLDSKVGYTGRVSFNVPSNQKCTAYVHRIKEAQSLAGYSYTSL
jgi:hypothetical protein